MLIEGLELMLAGMGTVFVFLTVLVAATSLMSHMVQRLHPPGHDSADPEEVAAISAALAQHRRAPR